MPWHFDEPREEDTVSHATWCSFAYRADQYGVVKRYGIGLCLYRERGGSAVYFQKSQRSELSNGDVKQLPFY